jgi:hypothetical protein
MGKSKKFQPDYPKVKAKKTVRRFIHNRYHDDEPVYTIGAMVKMEQDDFADLRDYYNNR